MHSRSKRFRRLALPLIAGLAMLLTAVVAGPARADPINNGVIAFQDNNQDLWYYNGTGSHDTGLGMASYTSPSIAYGDGNLVQIAFQANTNVLWAYWPQTGGSYNTGLYMDTGTSPSVAAQTLEVAYQSSDNDLWLATISVSSDDTGLPMAPGTSPSISGDGYEVAFQGDDGNLWVYSAEFNYYIDTGLGMENGTSPAIGLDSGFPGNSASQYLVAFQDNHGHLWYYYSGQTENNDAGSGAYNTGLDMESDTSPTIDPAYSLQMAFETPAGRLETYSPVSCANCNHTSGLGLAGVKAWPSTGAYYTATGGYVGSLVVFSAQTDDYLYTFSLNDGTNANLGPKLAVDTNPSYTPGVVFPACCSDYDPPGELPTPGSG
jgi:hypothetical protein